MTLPLVPIEIPRDIAGLPKADIHVHSESGPRLEQVIAARTGAKVTDWVEQARKLMRTVPLGMARLNGRDIPFTRSALDELDRSSGNFKARVGRVLVEAAADGAILVEVLFVSKVIRIEQRAITVECPLSCNVVVGAVESYERHPIRRFVERGIRVALCTDDPVRACTTIGREYAIAAELGFSTADLLACTRASVEASFCDRAARERLLRTLSAASQRGRAG